VAAVILLYIALTVNAETKLIPVIWTFILAFVVLPLAFTFVAPLVESLQNHGFRGTGRRLVIGLGMLTAVAVACAGLVFLVTLVDSHDSSQPERCHIYWRYKDC
jgi:type VI protein secretion system component VasK